MTRFADRRQAGHELGQVLAETYGGRDDVIVLGLPRGGVVVAAAVAEELGADLDVLVVRKVGAPGHEELAVGAVVRGAPPVLNEDVLRSIAISPATLSRLVDEQREECTRREDVFRHGLPALDVKGRTVLLVDDGLATGATMRAAVAALRPQEAAAVVVAVPVAPRDTLHVLQNEADAVVCLSAPLMFRAVGWAYDDFRQTSDDEVVAILTAARGSSTGG
jgi:predicted phosphoribosyltransferase